jgi:hypothetical protein
VISLSRGERRNDVVGRLHLATFLARTRRALVRIQLLLPPSTSFLESVLSPRSKNVEEARPN